MPPFPPRNSNSEDSLDSFLTWCATEEGGGGGGLVAPAMDDGSGAGGGGGPDIADAAEADAGRG